MADQTVHWENGKLIIFDESFNHEAKVYFSHNMLEIQIYSGVRMRSQSKFIDKYFGYLITIPKEFRNQRYLILEY